MNKGYRGLRCPVVFSSRTFAPDCNNRRMHNEKRLIETVNGYLRQMLERQSTDVFSNPDMEQHEDIEGRVEQLDREIAALELEAFWKQESRYINQVLHRLMDKKRFLLLDGEIIGIAEIDRRQRTRA